MFGPNGLRIASLYFKTVTTDGVPASVSVKLEERFDHHLPARMVISGLASPIVCWMPVSMVRTKVYACQTMVGEGKGKAKATYVKLDS